MSLRFAEKVREDGEKHTYPAAKRTTDPQALGIPSYRFLLGEGVSGFLSREGTLFFVCAFS